MHSSKLCPYRTETIIYHNDRKNYMIPSYGFNKLINYDVSEVFFKPCIEEECMFFDSEWRSCNLNNLNANHQEKHI